MFKSSQSINLSSNSNNDHKLNANNFKVENSVTENVSVPVFYSDVSRIIWNGDGLKNMKLNEKNEFIIDASNAGNNILFVGICGPNGQCDEISIKHLGKNVYNVCYQVKDYGMYMIVVKWGDNHIPGSPFNLITTE